MSAHLSRSLGFLGTHGRPIYAPFLRRLPNVGWKLFGYSNCIFLGVLES